MSRRAEIKKESRKQHIIEEKRAYEIQALLEIGNKYFSKYKNKYNDNPDMNFKLNIHIPAVYEVAKTIYPFDEIIQTGALLHDIGRIEEYERTLGFAGSGYDDHHAIGIEVLDNLWLDSGGDITSLVYQQVRNCVEFHGLLDFIDNDNLKYCSKEDLEVIRAVSICDDIVNAAYAPYYLMREQQMHAKSQSRGGFIPHENQWSKEVNPKLLDALKGKQDITINRNKECKTYADYNLYYVYLLTKLLKSRNLEVVKALISLAPEPLKIQAYLNHKGEIAVENEIFWRRGTDGIYEIACKLGEV